MEKRVKLSKLKAGTQIVVCDVGGGTTDFSLIKVVESEGKLSFLRMAVGDHLLLGGDNMDAAVAYLIESKLMEKGHELSATQRQQLFHEARSAKEKLLSEGNEDRCHLLLYGEGSGVVKGALSVDIHRREVQDLLLNGFFGSYSWEEALKHNKTTGLRSMGLPYESEPSIIKHLARFLADNKEGIQPIMPDWILFNGGAMTPPLFQKAIVDNLNSWCPEKKVTVLSSYHLDLAVSRGAAYYGKTRRGLGVKIGGGLARGYYMILDTKNEAGAIEEKALAIMPRGSEEGKIFEPEKTFMLMPNTPVSFQLAASHIRLHDKEGDLVQVNSEEMHLLPPIHTVLRFGKKTGGEQIQEKIPVHIITKLTPIGTLEIGLKSLKTEHQWALEFQLRTVSGQDHQIPVQGIKPKGDQTFDKGFLNEAEKVISKIFGTEQDTLKPVRLNEKLEEILELPKREWPPSVMRGLAESLLKTASFRKNTKEHAERWWNLTGFLLRPGFGYPLDDFKIKELWKIILSDFKSPLPLEVEIQLWICYRRIAGGLNKGQQMQLTSDMMTSLF